MAYATSWSNSTNLSADIARGGSIDVNYPGDPLASKLDLGASQVYVNGDDVSKDAPVTVKDDRTLTVTNNTAKDWPAGAFAILYVKAAGIADDAQQALADLQAQITDQAGDIAALRADVDANTGAIATNASAISGNASAISGLDARVTALETPA